MDKILKPLFREFIGKNLSGLVNKINVKNNFFALFYHKNAFFHKVHRDLRKSQYARFLFKNILINFTNIVYKSCKYNIKKNILNLSRIFLINCTNS